MTEVKPPSMQDLAGLEVGAVIQMQGDGQVGIFDDGRLHQLHQISVVGVSTGALGHLEDDGSISVRCTPR